MSAPAASGLELRWLTQEPALTLARVAPRLLLAPAGVDRLELDGATIRFVREPDVRAEGRLALVPVAGGEAAVAGREPTVALRTATRPGPRERTPSLRLAALGWATVDTERAGRDFAVALDLPGVPEPLRPEPLLGAFASRVRDPRLPGGHVILLEPSTEARAVASLVRDGEGPCTLYLVPDDSLAGWLGRARSAGIAASRPDDGPLGRAALILGGPVAGPHLVIVEPGDDTG